jgi:hypothetical protein
MPIGACSNAVRKRSSAWLSSRWADLSAVTSWASTMPPSIAPWPSCSGAIWIQKWRPTALNSKACGWPPSAAR